MLVYYFVPFIVSNRYLLFWVSNGHNSVTVQNWTHVYMNFYDHKDLGNHLLQLCPKVVKHPVYSKVSVEKPVMNYYLHFVKKWIYTACIFDIIFFKGPARVWVEFKRPPLLGKGFIQSDTSCGNTYTVQTSTK